jgi:glyoxylase I family protein
VSLGGIRNLDYAILLCNKLDETRAFYRDVMKFPIETDLENWVSFRVGAALLTLRRRGAWAATMGSQCPDQQRSSLPFESRPQR